MYPALSIIFFTSVSGLGYGLAVMLCLGAMHVPGFPDPLSLTGKVGFVVALVLITAGLLSSLLHLGHPERAWRALSQWRSSWLSREGVMAVITFIPLGFLALGSVIFNQNWIWLAPFALVGSLLTVYCTAMIYASLRTVHHWFTGLTPLVYLAVSLAGGGIIASWLTVSFQAQFEPIILVVSLILLIDAWLVKGLWWRRARTSESPSSPESATGLGGNGAQVRLLERPHVQANYLTHEMGFQVARKHSQMLRLIAIVTGLILAGAFLVLTLAIGLLWTGSPNAVLAFLSFIAVATFVVGMFIERWLFFAEAKHTVMLYYGAR